MQRPLLDTTQINLKTIPWFRRYFFFILLPVIICIPKQKQAEISREEGLVLHTLFLKGPFSSSGMVNLLETTWQPRAHLSSSVNAAVKPEH